MTINGMAPFSPVKIDMNPDILEINRIPPDFESVWSPEYVEKIPKDSPLGKPRFGAYFADQDSDKGGNIEHEILKVFKNKNKLHQWKDLEEYMKKMVWFDMVRSLVLEILPFNGPKMGDFGHFLQTSAFYTFIFIM